MDRREGSVEMLVIHLSPQSDERRGRTEISSGEMSATKASHVELNTLALGKTERTFRKTSLTSQVVSGGPLLSEATKLAKATPLSVMSILSGRVKPPYVLNIL